VLALTREVLVYSMGRGAIRMSESPLASLGFHRLGLLFSAVPLLAGVYSAYEVAYRDQAQHDTLAIFVNSLAPRLCLALVP